MESKFDIVYHEQIGHIAKFDGWFQLIYNGSIDCLVTIESNSEISENQLKIFRNIEHSLSLIETNCIIKVINDNIFHGKKVINFSNHFKFIKISSLFIPNEDRIDLEGLYIFYNCIWSSVSGDDFTIQVDNDNVLTYGFRRSIM